MFQPGAGLAQRLPTNSQFRHTVSTVGTRAFPIAGARIWNGFSPDVTSAPSLIVIKQVLKIVLFSCSYQHICFLTSFPDKNPKLTILPDNY